MHSTTATDQRPREVPSPHQKLHDACGLIGLVSHTLSLGPRLAFGLQALQHRGQDSAGVATFHEGALRAHHGMGWVSQVFTAQVIEGILGNKGIGHTRYATQGAISLQNAQPLLFESSAGSFALAHNGQLPDASALRARLLRQGVVLQSQTDSELLGHLIVLQVGRTWPERLRALIDQVAGAYALLVLTEEGVFGLRDRYGLRPLAIGHFVESDQRLGTVVASETSAIEAVGARPLFEVAPGEIVRLSADRIERLPTAQPHRAALCAFESIYFARPDSTLNGRDVHSTRRALGEALFHEAPVNADLVLCVPDTGRPAAMAYASAAGRPFVEAIIKNRLLGRTFIQPSEPLRREGVHLKYSTIPAILSGKKVVLVDDSLVRGHTLMGLIQQLRSANVAEVHVRIAAPAVRFPCEMGVDLPCKEQLIAHQHNTLALAQVLKADSLQYLSLQAMHRVLQGGQCDACFSGHSPHPGWTR